MPRLLFGRTDRADVGLAEDRRGNVGVVDAALFALEQVVRDAHPLGDGDRRQLHPVDDVADGVDVGHVGPVGIVNDDGAALGQCNPRCLEPEPSGRWPPPRGNKHEVHVEASPVVESAPFRAVDALDRLDALRRGHGHALGRHLVENEPADPFVEAAQEQLATVRERRLGPEAGEDPSEFHGDVAAAEDQHPFRELR